MTAVYVVDLTKETDIDLAPATVVQEVAQNLRTIFSTRKGEVPLDREFGLSHDMLDRPIPVARMLMQSEVYEAVDKYEPRAVVRSVEFDETIEDAVDGITKPRGTWSLKDEEEAI